MDRDGFVALGGKDLISLDPKPGFGFDDDEDDAVTVQMRDPFAMTPPGVERVETPPPMIEPEGLAAPTLDVPLRQLVQPSAPTAPRQSWWLLGTVTALGLLGVCLLAGYLAS